MRTRRIAVFAAVVLVVVGVLAGYTGIRAVGYEQYWRDRAAEQVPPDAFTLVAMGDSATVGVGALDPANGFVGRIASLVTERTGRPVRIVNVASGGATTGDVRASQVPAVELASADLVVLCTSNDLERGIPLDQYRADLEAIAAVVPSDRTVVSDLPLMPGREPYQFVLASVADSRGIARADFAAVFNGPGHRLDIFSLLPPHLNDRGYGYWFDAFRPAVVTILDSR